MNHYRKLLVYGVNELINQGLMSLDVIEEREGHSQVHFAALAGRYSAILWRGVGYDESRVSVWWDFDRKQYEDYRKDYEWMYDSPDPLLPSKQWPIIVGATASAWLERRDRKCLQGRGNRAIMYRYLRTGSKQQLDNLPTPVPLGYAVEGPIY